MVYPVPAVLISCGNREKSNLFTVAWTGTICSDPAMLYISVRPERASYELIKEQMEFTVNLTTRQLCRATDWCGVRSGRDYDKWKEMGLTAAPGVKVGCPHVDESPMSIECRVKSIVPLGTHHMFIAEVLSVLADEQYLDAESGAFDMERAGLIAYAHGSYYTLGEKLGKFGFSVQKKNNKH